MTDRRGKISSRTREYATVTDELEVVGKRIRNFEADSEDISKRMNQNSMKWKEMKSGPVRKGNERMPGDREVDFLLRKY